MLHDWANTWQIQYNMDKCHILHVGKNNMKFEYQLGGRDLKVRKWEKDVGVSVNDDLKPSLTCAEGCNQIHPSSWHDLQGSHFQGYGYLVKASQD